MAKLNSEKQKNYVKAKKTNFGRIDSSFHDMELD